MCNVNVPGILLISASIASKTTRPRNMCNVGMTMCVDGKFVKSGYVICLSCLLILL